MCPPASQPELPAWTARALRPTALGVSASRRTDIPALFGGWFEERLRQGWVEYRPAGPPRLIRRSLLPEDVTHVTFWTRWPRPFFPVLERVMKGGYPVLWNVTITGLGRSAVEPRVPSTDRAVRALKELSSIVSPAALQWRYDPIFLSSRYDEKHHVETFKRLGSELAGHVDRVAVSFVELYGRRVAPDLAAYESETGDEVTVPSLEHKVDLAGRLREIADELGLVLTICCDAELRARLRCSRAGCNAFSWACRVYPDLLRHKPPRPSPTRPDCGCSREIDIGAYDTCTFGCRYSYGTSKPSKAEARLRRHDPAMPCLGEVRR